ncbi:MAG: hypothetical protein LQ345_003034 [Seirophora villosa]|nr:MAG: hypothetical protein LQ345_003034 [Seirophora villosa]
MSAGFYRLQPGPELVYTYTYDEMKILVEGDMQIAQLAEDPAAAAKGEEEKGTKNEGETVSLVKEEVDAKKGDTFFFPKGAVVRFRTREGAEEGACGEENDHETSHGAAQGVLDGDRDKQEQRDEGQDDQASQVGGQRGAENVHVCVL